MTRPAPESAAPSAPGETALPARRRGRPPGARTRILLDEAGALGAHHFAFLRAWFQRLDLREAWQRYMAFAEPGQDLRRIERRRAELLRRVLHAGHQIDLTLPAAQRITRQLALLAQPPQAPPAAALPSLDEFIAAQGLDRDFYSEAELLQEYRQHHHLDAPPGNTPWAPDAEVRHASGAEARAQARALNQLERLLARAPGASDRLALWLSPALAQRLARAGITTLAGLADVLASGDAGWHRRVTGLGRTGAHKLALWVAPLAREWARSVPTQALLATPAQRALATAIRREQARTPAFGLVPLERLAAPTPAVQADLQAVQAWLARFDGRIATQRAYAREAERFFLWNLHLQRKPLTAVTLADLDGYARFLAAPPAAWIQALPVARCDAAWRPFRGPVSAASQRQALRIVGLLLAGLAGTGGRTSVSVTRAVTGDAGERAAEPATAGPQTSAVAMPAQHDAGAASTASDARKIGTSRRFTREEWCFLQARLDAEAAAAKGRGALQAVAQVRRLRLILELLARTGWRLSQLAGAQWVVPGQQGVQDPCPVGHCVAGAGGGARPAPSWAPDPDLLALIRQHHDDAGHLGALDPPAPLVCSLGERPRQWIVTARGAKGEGGQALLASPSAPPTRALGVTGIALTLKRFFSRAADQVVAGDGIDAQRLKSASAHWARGVQGQGGEGCSTVERPPEPIERGLTGAAVRSSSALGRTGALP